MYLISHIERSLAYKKRFVISVRNSNSLGIRINIRINIVSAE